jgi:hypothetical protein
MSPKLLIGLFVAATVLAISIFSAQSALAQGPGSNVRHAARRSPHHSAHNGSTGCDQRCQESWARAMAHSR